MLGASRIDIGYREGGAVYLHRLPVERRVGLEAAARLQQRRKERALAAKIPVFLLGFVFVFGRWMIRRVSLATTAHLQCTRCIGII